MNININDDFLLDNENADDFDSTAFDQRSKNPSSSSPPLPGEIEEETQCFFTGQKFTIQDICPNWGYAYDRGYTYEPTKVLIVGSFICEPSESEWKCMFGDVEVPAEIIQQGGVIECIAPPSLPANVRVCVTSGNQMPVSEFIEFEYRAKPTDLLKIDFSWNPFNIYEKKLFIDLLEIFRSSIMIC